MSDSGSVTPIFPQPAAWQILPGGTTVDWEGRGVVPMAWVSSAVAFAVREGSRRVVSPRESGAKVVECPWAGAEFVPKERC